MHWFEKCLVRGDFGVIRNYNIIFFKFNQWKKLLFGHWKKDNWNKSLENVILALSYKKNSNWSWISFKYVWYNLMYSNSKRLWRNYIKQWGK